MNTLTAHFLWMPAHHPPRAHFMTSRTPLLLLLALVVACNAPPTPQERAADAIAASGQRMALLSPMAAGGIAAGGSCAEPATERVADSLVVTLRCAVSVPRDTLVIALPDTALPPAVDTLPVPRVSSECTVRPNGRYRCTFDGSASTALRGLSSLVWTAPGEASQVGMAATFGFAPGSYVVTLTATDSGGAVVSLDAPIRVGVELPPGDTLPVDTTPPPPPPPVDTTPPLPGARVAALPRLLPVVPASLATAACTSTVTSDLQGAVNAAKAGDVLCLVGGFSLTLTLPNRADAGWVVVRSTSAPVAPGDRMRPTVANTSSLARIVAPGATSAIVTAPGAHGWYLHSLDVTTDATLKTLTYALVDLQTPPTLAQMPRDLVLDRLYIHGWPTRPLRRCVALNSAATTIINSWLDDCHEKGSDSQAIGAWSGSGPYLIENNYLAGAGENVLVGGADPKFPGVHPSDITFRRNHVNTPIEWKTTWTKKNILELKNVARILIERNVFEGSWGDGQTGYALVVKSANQSGGASSRDNGSRDVTIAHNLIRNASAAITINGRGGDAGNIDSLSRRIDVVENYADDIGGVYGIDNRGVMLLTGAQWVRLVRNTWLAPIGTVNNYTGGSVSAASTASHLTVDHDLLARGKYGRIGCWTAVCAPDLSFNAAVVGSGAAVASFTLFPDLASAHAAGYGVSRALINTLTAGVVVVP